MAETENVLARNAGQRQAEAREADALQRDGRRPEVVLRPATDIFEDDDGITLQMDLAGASRDRLVLEVHADRLDVQAELRLDMPDGMEALYADVRSTRYERSFALSGELETDKIEANLKDGVLTLRIPKRPAIRRRKIEVRAG
jgi:HSP20 family molecular chaperone IbpA